ncbi:MAG: SapC family protein [Roseibium sp.]|nr:SapC family protein [Roseibium sp.]
MVSIQPVSRDRHASKHWQRFSSYEFAQKTAVAPLVMAEFPKATQSFPIGFIKEADRYFPVAVLGIEPNVNLYVGPDGRWIGGYIPASLRGYPFRIGETEAGEQLLCIDEDSGLITDPPEGLPFFDENGDLTADVQQILVFLGQTYQNRAATLDVCKLLAGAGLIVPWDIKIVADDGEKALQGLHRIDEEALNKLDTGQFEKIRQAAALPLVYSQLLSMQHVKLLGKLTDARAQRAALMAKETPKVPELTQSLTESDTIDWSKFGM